MKGGGEGELERRLDALRSGVRREKEIQAELDETTRLLEGIGGRRSPVDDTRVASPCGESWEGMVGDARQRLCLRCDAHVYDLSAMTRDEAEVFLATRGATACVRFFRRDDGTVRTSDCPVGVRKKRVRLAILSAAGAGMLATAATTSLAATQEKPACRARGPSTEMAPGPFPPTPTATESPGKRPEGTWVMGARARAVPPEVAEEASTRAKRR